MVYGSQKNLLFAPALAPYRVDYYNYLHNHCGFEICFTQRMFDGQLFATQQLLQQSDYEPNFLKTLHLWDREFPCGVRKLIRRQQPQVVIVPEFSLLTLWVLVLKLLSRKKFRVVSQCDDSYSMLVEGGFSKVHGWARNIMMRWLDDVILVDSRAVEWYRKYYGKGYWMPIIRDESKMFTHVELRDRIEHIRQQYDLFNKTTILFVGRLVKVKNIPVLLEACAQLTRPYKLIVVGDGEMRTALEQQTERLHVEAVFVGQKNDAELYAYYHVADIFVLPSRLEAFGAVTNEALLSGCYCCISNKAGSSCLIDEGINGALFNPESSIELKEKIEQLSQLPSSENRKSRMTVLFEDRMRNLKIALGVE